jgi:hypothetical protein
MDPAAPADKTRRRGWCRFLWRLALISVALTLLAFALSNLWLSSSWGRKWIGARISRALTLDTSIGGASWSPWNGGTLRQIRIEQPHTLRTKIDEPLAELTSIRVRPVWRALVRGRIVIDELEVNRPALVIPVQLLPHLATAPTPPIAATPPPAAVPAKPIISGPDPRPAADPALSPKPRPVPIAAQPRSNPPGSAHVSDRRPTSWVRITQGSIHLMWAGRQTPLARIGEIDGNLPISGGPASSRLRLAPIEIGGQPGAQSIEAPLSWRDPVLQVGPIVIEEGGLRINASATVARAGGILINADLQIPDQPLPETTFAGGTALAESVTADVNFRGPLNSPASWKCDLMARATQISISRNGKQADFSIGGIMAVLRGGTFSCIDARLVGDSLSLLGNGTILADGRAAAVLRLVASPESAANITSGLFPGSHGDLPSTELGTSQRVAVDLEAFGTLDRLFLQIGKSGPVMDLKDALTPPHPAQ